MDDVRLSRRLGLADNYGLTGLGFAATAALVVVLGIAVIGTLAIALERHYGRITCRTFSAQTGRPTRFVIYNALDTGDCLTPTGNGKWIPTKNLREFGNGSR